MEAIIQFNKTDTVSVTD